MEKYQGQHTAKAINPYQARARPPARILADTRGKKTMIQHLEELKSTNTDQNLLGTGGPWPLGDRGGEHCPDTTGNPLRGPLLQGQETQVTFCIHKNINRNLA